MRTEKSFNCRGSRWSKIRKSSLGNDFVTIERDVTHSMLKRLGQVVSGIDVKRYELPLKYRNLTI